MTPASVLDPNRIGMSAPFGSLCGRPSVPWSAGDSLVTGHNQVKAPLPAIMFWTIFRLFPQKLQSGNGTCTVGLDARARLPWSQLSSWRTARIGGLGACSVEATPSCRRVDTPRISTKTNLLLGGSKPNWITAPRGPWRAPM
jgi:hypothetical protein